MMVRIVLHVDTFFCIPFVTCYFSVRKKAGDFEHVSFHSYDDSYSSIHNHMCPNVRRYTDVPIDMMIEGISK